MYLLLLWQAVTQLPVTRFLTVPYCSYCMWQNCTHHMSTCSLCLRCLYPALAGHHCLCKGMSILCIQHTSFHIREGHHLLLPCTTRMHLMHAVLPMFLRAKSCITIIPAVPKHRDCPQPHSCIVPCLYRLHLCIFSKRMAQQPCWLPSLSFCKCKTLRVRQA